MVDFLPMSHLMSWILSVLFIYPSIYLSIYLILPISLCLSPSVSLSSNLPLSLSIHTHTYIQHAGIDPNNLCSPFTLYSTNIAIENPHLSKIKYFLWPSIFNSFVTLYQVSYLFSVHELAYVHTNHGFLNSNSWLIIL